MVYSLQTTSNPEAIARLSSPEDGKRWLVWAMRDDCFVHYLDVEGSIALGLGGAPVKTKFNTNELATDEHISYSILSIVKHPHVPLLSLVTGAHAPPGAYY